MSLATRVAVFVAGLALVFAGSGVGTRDECAASNVDSLAIM